MFYGLSPVSGFGTGVVNVRRDPSHYSYCTHGLGQAEDRTTPHSTLQGFFWIPEQLGFSPKFTYLLIPLGHFAFILTSGRAFLLTYVYILY